MDVSREIQDIQESIDLMVHVTPEAGNLSAAETGTATEGVIPELELSLPRPLSPFQQKLWFMALSNPDVPAYNEAEAVKLTGELNVEALEEAMNVVVGRHEALRSTIRNIDGVPHSVIHNGWPFNFEKIDVSDPSLADREIEVDRRLIDEPRAYNDLEANPGLRVALLHLSPNENVLILRTHHVLCDWGSIGVIWQELSALYDSFVTGVPAVLSTLPISRKYDSVWQQRLDDHSMVEDMAFWEETLLGAPVLLELPADRPRPATMSNRGGRLRRKLSRGLTEGLRTTSRKETASLFAIFVSALNTLIYRYTGSDDISLGICLSDSYHPELQSSVGFLSQTHVLRSSLSGDMTFRDLTSRAQKAGRDLSVHRSVPFDEIVRRLMPEQNPSYFPVFQVMLSWRDRNQQPSFIGLEGREIEPLAEVTTTSKCDLSFFVKDTEDEISLEVEYSTDLFDEDRIARMLGHYETVLEAVVIDSGARIGRMRLLTRGERQQILVDWNQTESGYPKDKCLDELIYEQIERSPDATAVVCDGSRLTYGDLGDRADQLASYLRERGVDRNALVAIYVDRSLDLVVGLLGTLRAGAAYLPLAPTFPLERLSLMLRDAQPLVLLTQSKLLELLPAPCQSQVVCLDALPKSQTLKPTKPVDRSASDLAYVLYTSGSTGTPKGVQIQHAALVNFLISMQRAPGIAATDTMLAITTLSFDIAGLELFLPLTIGARVVIAPEETVRDGKQLATLMKVSGTTIMQGTPATWQMLLDSGWEGKPELKILCGGEAWSTELASKLLPRCKSLWNMYGPTETTIWSSVSRVEKDKPVVIAPPIANTTFYVLDGLGQLLPCGIPGELYIGGHGLALGYLRRPDLTNERFVPDPLRPQGSARLYKTGDVVRRCSDGSIEFLGRVDDQVKLRGFRIELSEIQSVLSQHAGVSQCFVMVEGEGVMDKRLVAYVVLTNPRKVPTAEDLKDALRMRLPSYMIPASFIVVEKMPLTPNGKIDRIALSHSSSVEMTRQAPIDAPRDPIEAKMVRIWERVLDISPIGIRTNFFDVGGYSLMIVKLFTQINKAFGRSLPIATIFSAPTIEQLATLVRGRTVNSRALVPIRTSGRKEPLFIVHSYLTYERFRQVVDPDRPLYGLHESEDDPNHVSSFVDRVADYVSQIRELQPQGPYFLIGWCAAAPLTVELARSLQESGCEVEMLGLIDAEHPDYFVENRWEQNSKSIRERIWATVRYHRHRRALFSESGVARYSWSVLLVKISAAWQNFLAHRSELVFSLCSFLGISGPGSLHNLPTWSIENIEPYDGRITLFRPRERHDTVSDPTLGWRNVALKGVEIVWTPGDHESMFFEPHLSVFGRLLDGAMGKRGSRKKYGDLDSRGAVFEI